MGSVGISLAGFPQGEYTDKAFGASRRGKCWLLFNLSVSWLPLGVSEGHHQVTRRQPGTLAYSPASPPWITRVFENAAWMFPDETTLQKNSEPRQAHSGAGLFASRHFNYSVSWQQGRPGRAERTSAVWLERNGPAVVVSSCSLLPPVRQAFRGTAGQWKNNTSCVCDLKFPSSHQGNW